MSQVNILRGGGGRASGVSMAEGDESAYGSVSGRSSLVSTLDRFLHFLSSKHDVLV